MSFQGDFLVHFMDIAREELRRRPAQISVEKLQSLLELALRTSVCSADPFNDDLTCDLVSEPEQLRACAALATAYSMWRQLFATLLINGCTGLFLPLILPA
jgi:hypothetical protein